MWRTYIALIIWTVLSHVDVIHSAPTTEAYTTSDYLPPDSGWYDWQLPESTTGDVNSESSTSSPGQVVGDVTLRDVLKMLGRAWNAGSFRQSAKIGCDLLGEPLNEATRWGDLELIRPICELFEQGVDIGGACYVAWDKILEYSYNRDFIGLESISIIPSAADCAERIDGNFNNKDSGGGGITLESLRDIYDHCSDSGARKLNNILFALTDWFGPSVFGGYYNYHYLRPNRESICATARHLLSMDTIDLFKEVFGILKFPVADFLDSIDICEPDTNVITAAVRELTTSLADYHRSEDFCRYVLENSTRKSNLDVGYDIVKNALVGNFIEVKRCSALVGILVPLDTAGVHSIITGYNLTDPEETSRFCHRVSLAFLSRSSYEPAPYTLNFDYPRDLLVPGSRLLPDLFLEVIRVYGSASQAQRVVDGVGIFCTVFKDLTGKLLGHRSEVDRICSAIDGGDVALVEDQCLLAIPRVREYPPFLWFRTIPDLTDLPPTLTSLYIARRISGIDNVNKEDICSIFEEKIDEVTLRRFTETMVDVLVAELLPAAAGICDHWEQFMCYMYTHYGGYCNGTAPVTPNEEEKRPYLLGASAAWKAAGYDSQRALCSAVTESIETSGKPNPVFVEYVRGRIIDLLYESERCAQVIGDIMGLLVYLFPEPYFSIPDFHELTGYRTHMSMCEDLREAFLVSPVMSSTVSTPVSSTSKPPDNEGGKVLTYNILANISVYLKGISRR